MKIILLSISIVQVVFGFTQDSNSDTINKENLIDGVFEYMEKDTLFYDSINLVFNTLIYQNIKFNASYGGVYSSYTVSDTLDYKKYENNYISIGSALEYSMIQSFYPVAESVLNTSSETDWVYIDVNQSSWVNFQYEIAKGYNSALMPIVLTLADARTNKIYKYNLFFSYKKESFELYESNFIILN